MLTHLSWTNKNREGTSWAIVIRISVSLSLRFTFTSSTEKEAIGLCLSGAICLPVITAAVDPTRQARFMLRANCVGLLGLCVEKHFLARSGKGLWLASNGSHERGRGCGEGRPWSWPLGFLWSLVLALALRLFSLSYDPYFPHMVPRKAHFPNATGSDSWKWVLIWCEV